MKDFLDFELPPWLKYNSREMFHEKALYEIKAKLPNIDISEGSFTWDWTSVLAMLTSRTVGFNITEFAKNVFPQFAYGSFLDYHANTRGLFRRDSERAHGLLTFTGEPGTVIEEGTIAITTSDTPGDSLSFETTERGVIMEGGSVCLNAVALKSGTESNVAAYMITALNSGMSGVSTVFNPVPFTGGKDRESDEELRERIKNFDQRIFSSYVGTEQDYKLWALEVPGVAGVQVEGCLDRTGDGGDGIVHLSITDQAGQSADEALKATVYDHLMSPGEPENKLVAVNSKLNIETPESSVIDIRCDIKIDKTLAVDTSIEDIANELGDLVRNYLTETYESGVVYRREIGALLIQIYGVLDYENLTLNGAKENITLGYSELPVLGEINLSEIV